MVDSRRFGRFRHEPTAGLTYRPDTREVQRQLGLVHLMRKGVQAALYAAHMEAAQTVQVYAAEELERRRTPRPRRENLLAKSIMDPANRNVTASQWEVGIEDWLFHRSPAWRYARRIEWGGPNPMARFGPIVGGFWTGTGDWSGQPLAAPGEGGLHGRLRWTTGLRTNTRGKTARLDGAFTINPNDVVARQDGYQMHSRAGRRFADNRDMFEIYERHFLGKIPGWVELRRSA